MTTLKDIIGYESEVKDLYYLCDMMKNGQKYIDMGVYVPKTLLLHGNPGTGKTTMAKALINDSGRECFKCKKNKSNGDFVDEIRKTFEDAKKNEPSIVLLDDMDKFAEDNLELNQNKEEFATIQTCIEDLGDSDVFVIATCNDITYLPESLLRAGRFGRQMHIGNPDCKSAEKLIKYFIENGKMKSELSSDSLAHILNNCSCAVIKEVINEASIYALFNNSNVITKKDYISALLKVIYKESEREIDCSKKQIEAKHEAGHIVVALYNHKEVSMASISNSPFCGGITCVRDEDEYSKYDLKQELLIALAGKAATELDNNKQLDYGANDDVSRAARQARKAIEECLYSGFDYGYDMDKWETKQSLEKVARITEKVYQLLEETYEEAKEILKLNRAMLEEITAELINNRTLLYDDINAIANKYSWINVVNNVEAKTCIKYNASINAY